MARRTPTTDPGRRTQTLPRGRRTAGDFFTAFLAFVVLVVLLVGVPGALAYSVGWPLPRTMPSLDTLQQEITTTVFVKVLTVVVWLAWAQFTACVLVEAKAELSGVGVPSRIPGAGPSQMLARQLVAAVLLVGATAASFAPGISQLGQHLENNARPTVAAAQQAPGQQAAAEARQQGGDRSAQAGSERQLEAQGAPEARVQEDSTKFYRIQPPEGRHHDSLWEIAERHLDDGRRYKEIYQLNKDRIQPDGSRLSQASLIRPGWIMEMPADAHGGELVEIPDAAPEVPENVVDQIHDYDRSSPSHADAGGGDRAEGGGTGAGRADTVSLGPDRPVEAGGAGGQEQRVADPGPAPEQTVTPASDASSFGLSEALIGAPLLAAGVLAALGRRRRAALWQSAMGVVGGSGRTPDPVTPTGAAADAQDALLVGADPDAVRDLDGALRGLADSLADESRGLPTAYAAWLTDNDINLQLAHPAGQPPAPWQLGQDQTFWRVRRRDIQPYEGDAGVAPYPGLVSLGSLDNARLLLNLEAVPGIVSLAGAREDRTAVLSSVAAELGTSGWSDRLTVTLVGFGADLTALAPTRIRHVDDVEALLETMDVETGQRRRALGNAGHDSVLTGRTGPAQHAQWAPHLVLIGDQPTEEQAVHLAELAADSGRLGIGYLVGAAANDLPGASWEFEITDDGRLLAPLLRLELKAQTLPRAQHEAVVRLFADIDGEPAAGSSRDADDQPFMVDITERGRPAVYARLVGPYEVIGLDDPDGERSPLLHEALAMLLLHREGVHPRVLASGLWPRGVTEDVRDALIERLRLWLGSDTEDGSPRLRTDGTGRLTLAESVVSDLDVLRTLHHEATQGRGASRASVRERLLTDALALARGPLLADRPAGRYGWLSHEIIEAQLPLLVADVALALSAHHLEAGRAETAIETLNTSLISAPADERLWNELLRAVHATGDTALLGSTAEALITRNRALNGGTRGLPPRTEALLDELLPSWRTQLAAAN